MRTARLSAGSQHVQWWPVISSASLLQAGAACACIEGMPTSYFTAPLYFLGKRALGMSTTR